MKKIITGETVEQAIEQGLRELGVTKEEAVIEVLEREKKSLFGKVKQRASIEISLKEIPQDIMPSEETCLTKQDIQEDVIQPQDQKEYANGFLNNILDAMGLEDYIVDIEDTQDGIFIDISTNSKLLTHKMDPLNGLQNVVNLALNKGNTEYKRVSIDCNHFRKQRKERLEQLALKIADNVKRTGNHTTMEPMRAYERKIVHSVLQEISGIKTESVGKEPYRKVVVKSIQEKKVFREKEEQDSLQQVKQSVDSITKTKI